MSQPKRYSVAVNDPWFGNGAYVAEDGKYVLHSDYAALAAENERLKQPWVKIITESETWNALSEVARLTAENERLRKAGDALQKGWIKDIRQTAAGRMTIKTIEDCCPAIAAWNAAREGRDAP